MIRGWRSWLVAGVASWVAGHAALGATPLQERADRFLSLVNAGYQALYRVESEAQWKASTDVKPEHDAASETAGRARAAFNGNPAIIREARELLGRVGLGERYDHYPVQLSGGEQQRVALARAFMNRPKILFCDEPTGNLDGATAAAMVELIFGLNREKGTTLVLVTHDLELARKCQRIIRLKSGAVVSDETA
jgi:ABC-type dipeptide/oligopeptide/nickel transport system ATPase component